MTESSSPGAQLASPSEPTDEQIRAVWDKTNLEWLGHGGNPYLAFARAVLALRQPEAQPAEASKESDWPAGMWRCACGYAWRTGVTVCIKCGSSRAALAEPSPALATKLDDSEQYRMQIAGICTAAFGYWKEGDAIHPDYDTIALRDVARLYAKYDHYFKLAHAEPSPVAQPVPASPTAGEPVPVGELVALRRNAARYKVLRDQRHGFRTYRLNPKPGNRWRGWSDEGDIYKGDELDKEIDGALSAYQQRPGQAPSAEGEKS